LGGIKFLPPRFFFFRVLNTYFSNGAFALSAGDFVLGGFTNSFFFHFFACCLVDPLPIRFQVSIYSAYRGFRPPEMKFRFSGLDLISFYSFLQALPALLFPLPFVAQRESFMFFIRCPPLCPNQVSGFFLQIFFSVSLTFLPKKPFSESTLHAGFLTPAKSCSFFSLGFPSAFSNTYDCLSFFRWVFFGGGPPPLAGTPRWYSGLPPLLPPPQQKKHWGSGVLWGGGGVFAGLGGFVLGGVFFQNQRVPPLFFSTLGLIGIIGGVSSFGTKHPPLFPPFYLCSIDI